MSITDVIGFLKGLGVESPIYPYAFPASSPDEAVIVEVGDGFNSRGSVFDIVLTLTVRAGHPSRGEALSQDVINRLDGLTGQTVGDMDFILIKSQQVLPSYLGVDANGKHFHMNNFKVLASK